MQRATWLVLAVFGLGMALSVVQAQTTKVPDVKEIMKRMNKGNDALMPVLRKGLQEASPNWAEIQKEAKEFNSLAAAMEKNTPPMGSKDSWSRLTSGYAGITQALENAAQKMDKSAALAAHAKLKMTCMTCHKAHRQ